MSEADTPAPDQTASATTPPAQSAETDPLATLKSTAGLLLGAFGSVLTVIGINSGEVSSILRNDEWKVLLVLFLLFVSISVAFLSAVVGNRTRWTTTGIVGGLVLVVAGYAAVMAAFPLDEQNAWTPARNVARVIAIVLPFVGAGLIGMSFRGWWKHRKLEKETAIAAAPLRVTALETSQAIGPATIELNNMKIAQNNGVAGADTKVANAVLELTNAETAAADATATVDAVQGRVPAFGIDLQPWLVVFSGLLLGLSVLGAVRIESRNQQDDTVQVTPNVAAPSEDVDVVTVTVAAPRLSSRQQITFTMSGVTVDDGATVPLETVHIRPDATGLAKQTLIVPVSLLRFNGVTGTASVHVPKNQITGFTVSKFNVHLPSVKVAVKPKS
jgi:hypothetical protein